MKDFSLRKPFFPGRADKTASLLLPLALSALLGFSACSSAPKRPMMETTVYQQSLDRYEAANAQLISFQTQEALSNLQIAQRLACSIDNVDLLCKIYLSAVIYRLTSTKEEGGNPTVFDGKSAEELLAAAQKFAARSENARFLQSVSKVYEQKVILAKGEAASDESITSSQKDFSKDPYYLGFSYRTLGDVYAQQKKWPQAIAAYQEAASIHTKNRYLIEIGLDWFSLARAQSLSGKKDAAIDSLNTALSFDKAAENSGAIATDYLALSKLLMKGNPTDSDRSKAKDAALWASQVYESAGFSEEAKASSDYARSL